MEEDQDWENIEDITNSKISCPVFDPKDLDNREAQCILKDEDERISQSGREFFNAS